MNKAILAILTIVQIIFFVVIVPFLPLLVSWRWDWVEAWIYALTGLLMFIISRLITSRLHPGLLKERAKFLRHADTAPFDKYLAPLVGIANIFILIIAGMQAYEKAPVLNITEELLAFFVLLAGYVLSGYALVANPFFSGVVRLQKERNHSVVRGGPYRWIRHPGYASGILVFLATPFFLDSTWSILAAIVAILILIVRTGLEDNFLQEKLEGYRDYARQVPYRLFPGIW